MNVAVPAFIFARVLFHMQYAHLEYSTWHMKYTYAENISGHDILCSDKKLLSFAHFTFDHQGLL